MVFAKDLYTYTIILYNKKKREAEKMSEAKHEELLAQTDDFRALEIQLRRIADALEAQVKARRGW